MSVDAKALQEALSGADPVPELQIPGYIIGAATPMVAVRPQTIDGIATVLTAATRLGAAVVPWGGGTRMGMGNPPRHYDLALDMRGLNSVVEHRPADLVVTVEAGCTVQALQDVLLESGQYLPLDPPLPAQATVGGVLATGIGGPLSTAFGTPRDMVIGMRAVLADGSIVKNGGIVVKNVTGYAMDRLYIGAMGTLAVIAEATFKVTPLPRAEATVVATFSSMNAAVAACNVVAAKGLPLLSAEVLNQFAWRQVDQTTDGNGDYTLLLRVAGRTSAVARSIDSCLAACREIGEANVESLNDDASSALWKKVTDLGWESGPPELGLRLLGTPTQSAELVALAVQGTDAAVSVSPTRGVVKAYWNINALPPDVPAYITGLREAVTALNGSVVVESRSKLEGVDAWGPTPDGFTVMRQLKEQYDPQGILNPGRYVGGI
ncbi:MAG: FAD-binding oxidoreductase [Chloroflexi bacterium]|nr:FAD-binding oxidoreductase [Chloroflexota bacterium]